MIKFHTYLLNAFVYWYNETALFLCVNLIIIINTVIKKECERIRSEEKSVLIKGKRDFKEQKVLTKPVLLDEMEHRPLQLSSTNTVQVYLNNWVHFRMKYFGVRWFC